MASSSTMTSRNLEVTLGIKLVTWYPSSSIHGDLRILLNPVQWNLSAFCQDIPNDFSGLLNPKKYSFLPTGSI